MEIKLFDSELKIMDVLWKNGGTTAKQIAKILKENLSLEEIKRLKQLVENLE